MFIIYCDYLITHNYIYIYGLFNRNSKHKYSRESHGDSTTDSTWSADSGGNGVSVIQTCQSRIKHIL